MTPLEDLFRIPPNRTFADFREIWLHCFLTALCSSVIVHAIAAAVAFSHLRKHQWGRFIPVLILVMGVISPLTCGAITSAAIAGIYKAADFEMEPLYSLVWGVAQTALLAFISFTRFLFTL